jgi:hypothetical protein
MYTKVIKSMICSSVILITSITSVEAAPISGQGTWETTLEGRDLDGNAATFEAYYDTALDITWLADANAAAGSGYDILGSGLMYLSEALDWVSGLNVNGVTGWRLPDTNPIDGISYDGPVFSSNDGSRDAGLNITAPGSWSEGSLASEMAHMYYNTLGNLSPCKPYSIPDGPCQPETGDWGLTNTGPFSNISAVSFDEYLSGSQYLNYTFVFNFADGAQNYETTFNLNTTFTKKAWAVRDGDVGVVPVPAAIWLFGSGLLGLIGIARRKKA